MKGLHEVVHRDEQAQGVMGLRHSGRSCAVSFKIRLFLANRGFSTVLGLFSPFIFEETTFQIVQLNM